MIFRAPWSISIVASVVKATSSSLYSSSVPNSMPDQYNNTAILVEYATPFSTMNAILSTNMANETMHAALNSFTKPLQDYHKAILSGNVGNDQRQSSMVGLFHLLSTTDSFSSRGNVELESWMMGEISDDVISQDAVKAVLEARNSIYNDISNATTRSLAEKEAIQHVFRYAQTYTNIPTEQFGTLITNGSMDWRLYSTRYFMLVTKVLVRNITQWSMPVRVYLAEWLATGNQNDTLFDMLLGNYTAPTQVSPSIAVTANAARTSKATEAYFVRNSLIIMVICLISIVFVL